MKRRLRPSIKRALILTGKLIIVGSVVFGVVKRYQTHINAPIFNESPEQVLYSHDSKKSLYAYKKPCSDSAVKSYMYVQSITSKTSDQYRFIQEYMTARNGLMFDQYGFIGVALGSQFGAIGSRWVFKLDTGNLLYVVKIDEKDDAHTYDGCQHRIDNSVIELVIDKDTNVYEYGGNGLILNGNFNNHPDFEGRIVGVRKEVNYE